MIYYADSYFSCLHFSLFAISKILVAQAQNEFARLIPILAKQQGVTEQLKAENQLKWVGLMNNIKAQVEEKFMLK